MADTPTPIRPREELLRRVDWLAVAPWLLVLRAVGATIGWPLVIGSIGMIALEWDSDVSNNPRTGSSLNVVSDWARSFQTWIQLPRATSVFYMLGWPVVRYFGWLFLGLAIIDCAKHRLGDACRASFLSACSRTIGRFPRVLGAVGMLALPAGFLLFALRLMGLAMKSESLDLIAAGSFGIGAACFALPVALLFLVGVVGAPLLVASIVIDDADPFDALSRTFAYVLQKPGTLVACVALAWCGLFLGGVLLEVLLRQALDITTAIAGFPRPQFEHSVAESSVMVFTRAARGFYPAYIFVAGAAIYLVMRHAVDGQPLDEIGQSPGDA